MIAGTRPRGLGGLVARFDEPHDGTVAVRETRAPGLADHLLLPASHTGLMFSADAVARAASRVPWAQNRLPASVFAIAARLIAAPIPPRRACGCTTSSAIPASPSRGGLRLR